MSVKVSEIKNEVQITTARSGGPGGQHVNKVESKVVLRWNVRESTVVTETDRELLLSKLATKLSKDGDLIITSEAHRSQLKNKEIAFKKLDRILTKVFTKPKVRKATQPSKAAKEKRLNTKKGQAEKKKWRQKPD